MARSEELYLRDIAESLEILEGFVTNRTYAEFLSDVMFQDAVIRRLEIVGEAAAHVSGPTRERHSNVEWRSIVAFRNFAIHAYFSLDLAIVWTTATANAPGLAPLIRAVIQLEYPEP